MEHTPGKVVTIDELAEERLSKSVGRRLEEIDVEEVDIRFAIKATGNRVEARITVSGTIKAVLWAVGLMTGLGGALGALFGL